VFKLKRFSYGTTGTPEAWSERLTRFLINQGYREGELGKPLSIKETVGNIMIALVFGDNILFGGMSNLMVQHLTEEMDSKFAMVLVGELSYFLGL
jgi:dTDP-glucose pyrophosphorylase